MPLNLKLPEEELLPLINIRLIVNKRILRQDKIINKLEEKFKFSEQHFVIKLSILPKRKPLYSILNLRIVIVIVIIIIIP
jgi:hypothetical protein